MQPPPRLPTPLPPPPLPHLESDAHTLPPIVEGRAPAVAAVDGCIHLPKGGGVGG